MSSFAIAARPALRRRPRARPRSQAGGRQFEKALRDIAMRALRRYPQPGGIAAGSQAVVKFRFALE